MRQFTALSPTESGDGQDVTDPQNHTVVIPAPVVGIQRAEGAGVRGWMDPGDKSRDDNVI